MYCQDQSASGARQPSFRCRAAAECGKCGKCGKCGSAECGDLCNAQCDTQQCDPQTGAGFPEEECL